MDIVGLGSHLVECAKIAQLMQSHAEQFLERYFTAREIASCQSRRDVTERFAGVWAAKEAVFRSLGVKPGATTVWIDVEVQEKGADCVVRFGPSMQKRITQLKVRKVLVTVARVRTIASATAIACGGE